MGAYIGLGGEVTDRNAYVEQWELAAVGRDTQVDERRWDMAGRSNADYCALCDNSDFLYGAIMMTLRRR